MHVDWQSTSWPDYDERQHRFTQESEHYRLLRSVKPNGGNSLRSALGRQLVKLGEVLLTNDQPAREQKPAHLQTEP